MATAPFQAAALIVGTFASTAATAYGINQSKKAAEVEGQAREDMLDRKQEDARNALRENTKRRLQEKKRMLSRVRVQNARSGMANSGTQLAVLGEIESRLDERIEHTQPWRDLGQIEHGESRGGLLWLGGTCQRGQARTHGGGGWVVSSRGALRRCGSGRPPCNVASGRTSGER